MFSKLFFCYIASNVFQYPECAHACQFLVMLGKVIAICHKKSKMSQSALQMSHNVLLHFVLLSPCQHFRTASKPARSQSADQIKLHTLLHKIQIAFLQGNYTQRSMSLQDTLTCELKLLRIETVGHFILFVHNGRPYINLNVKH